MKPLLLSLSLLAVPVMAQENNLVTNPDFEAPDLATWNGIFSREPGAVQVTRDTAEKHGGAASLKVVYSGEKDWAALPLIYEPIGAASSYLPPMPR